MHKKPGRTFGSSTKRKREASPSFSRKGEGEGEGEGEARTVGPATVDRVSVRTASLAPPRQPCHSRTIYRRGNHMSGSSPYEPYAHHSASGRSSGHSFAYGTPAEPAHAQLHLHDDLGHADASTGDRAHAGPIHGPATARSLAR